MNESTAVTYTVTISHWDDGELVVSVSGIGASDEDRASLAWALRRAAEMADDGILTMREEFS
jgi:hypothetical protein